MGAQLSCLVAGLSISDLPSEPPPLPARPVSQRQLSQRRTRLQLEYSNAHGEEVPRYRRQSAAPGGARGRGVGFGVGMADENDEERAGVAYGLDQPRGLRRLGLGLEYNSSDGHGEITPRHRRQTTQSQHPQHQALHFEPPRDTHSSAPIQARRSHRQPQPQSQAPNDENGVGILRQPQPQRPIRRPLALEHGDDAGMLRHGRGRSARRRYDVETLAPPDYEEVVVVVGRGDRVSRGRGEGGEEGPPRYEDHVFDWRVEDE
ncbi:MAG: hypothetical protein ALECFALPRED_004281 [Alectoria fallacina]|uniref:Uncharacterized protein n=1 Tax=Alectoria fallacina TaxID=1903189 RepID=A0A8H3IQ40_9LECA|nr:MAG: hypothetical protein ALECFALPRED_004281 [Alectoria fallacina]